MQKEGNGRDEGEADLINQKSHQILCSQRKEMKWREREEYFTDEE